MKVGTKSLLFGYHQFLLHPLFVWAAWLRLYGWTWDHRIICAFFLHDIGYWGRPNMDGEEGKEHPYLGALILSELFDENDLWDMKWFHFSLCHSRSMAKEWQLKPSKLCYADKLAFTLYPKWLVWALGGLSGENKEYLVKDGLMSFAQWMDWAYRQNENCLKEAGLWK